MPAASPYEHPAVTFALRLHALIAEFHQLLDPADVGIVLSTELAAITQTYADEHAAAALRVYFSDLGKKNMAKALLES